MKQTIALLLFSVICVTTVNASHHKNKTEQKFQFTSNTEVNLSENEINKIKAMSAKEVREAVKKGQYNLEKMNKIAAILLQEELIRTGAELRKNSKDFAVDVRLTLLKQIIKEGRPIENFYLDLYLLYIENNMSELALGDIPKMDKFTWKVDRLAQNIENGVVSLEQPINPNRNYDESSSNSNTEINRNADQNQNKTLLPN